MTYVAGIENGKDDRNRSTTYQVSLNAKEEMNPIVWRRNQQDELYERDHMARIHQEDELTSRELVADLNAPNETETRQQELTAESLTKLKIRIVVANAAIPRVEDLAYDGVRNNEYRLESQMGLAKKVDTIGASIAIEAEIDARIGPFKHVD